MNVRSFFLASTMYRYADSNSNTDVHTPTHLFLSTTEATPPKYIGNNILFGKTSFKALTVSFVTNQKSGHDETAISFH